MKYKLIITCLHLFLCIATKAQILHTPADGQYAHIGVYSNQLSNAFTGLKNQASLAGTKNFSGGIFTERRFMLKELGYYQAAAALPTKYGGIGVAVNYFGYSDYNESQLSMGYGKKLGANIDLGIGFMYNAYKISGYGNDGAMSFAIGSIWHINKQIHVGVHVYNPVGGKFGETKTEKIPSVYTAGVAYEIPAQFYISTEMIKVENAPAAFALGLQYSFGKQFFTKAGLNTSNNNWFVGFGVGWKQVRLDVAASYQQQLGVTPCLQLLFQPIVKAEN